ncbi:MAG: helix-turn-helix domain-containing protein [Nitrospiria bacterium]
MPKKGYTRSQRRVDISVGESVRMAREFNNLSHNELAKTAGIPQSTISGIEKDRIKLGAERAKLLARALHCHPAVLLFPDWDICKESAA